MSTLTDPTAYHLRPTRGWLNDPNGMVHRDGRWHVFFQHNPAAPRHGQIGWGHASSTDLVHWREHPVAFGPTPDGPDSFGCWSGVFVDGLDRPAVVYSGVTDSTGASTVCLRWGSEDLDQWGEPVVVGCTPTIDQVAVMRDPFVFDHGGRRWAILGAGLSDGTPAVLLFACDDITRWEYVGLLVTGADPVLGAAGPADVWECPQLVPVEGGHALLLSLLDGSVLGEVVGVFGELVDSEGRPGFVARSVGVLDHGNAFYAPQVALDDQVDEQGEGHAGAWLMGWIREDDQDPAEQDHAGCMTLPRRVIRDRGGLDGAGGAGGVRLVPDPRVVSPAGGLQVGPARQVVGGRLELRGAVQVQVGGSGVRLVHPQLGEVDLPEGSSVWVDGTVTEVFVPDLAPRTTRHTLPWQVVVPLGSSAAVRDVLTRAVG